MLISYSAEEGWIEGARMTFDGEHPCDLCVAIADAKQQESDSEAPGKRQRSLESGLELKPCPLAKPVAIVQPSASDLNEPGRSRPASSTPRPPTAPDSPPPRRV